MRLHITSHCFIAPLESPGTKSLRSRTTKSEIKHAFIPMLLPRSPRFVQLRVLIPQVPAFRESKTIDRTSSSSHNTDILNCTIPAAFCPSLSLSLPNHLLNNFRFCHCPLIPIVEITDCFFRILCRQTFCFR